MDGKLEGAMGIADASACDASTMPWEEIHDEDTGKTILRKLLVQDPDTGMEVMIVRYEAGVVTPWHRHSCAHGMYVLKGTLRTHNGTLTPGSFVWFPEGGVAEHGATATEAVEVVFITNKAFDIHHLAGEEIAALGL